MKSKSLISIKELTRQEIEALLDKARLMKESAPSSLLKGKIMASCFFEPSTRTRLSFEAAMKRLGGDVIGFSKAEETSHQKGESLQDAIKMMGFYSDLIVIRHPLEGSAKRASEATDKPVINAGDGSNEHPTQTLLDLYSILECQGKLDGLNIVCVGDLLHGRTVHSLAAVMQHFKNRLYFVSPEALAMPEKMCQHLKSWDVRFSSHTHLEEVIESADIIYMTRVQKERFADADLYERFKSHYLLTPELMRKARPNLKVLHPLPRLQEIPVAFDSMPQAYYFNQAENGLFVRQALLAELLYYQRCFAYDTH